MTSSIACCMIAPEFAGVDLGMAEKLAARALAEAAGVTSEQVQQVLRDTGDLGHAAEQLLGEIAGDRARPRSKSGGWWTRCT